MGVETNLYVYRLINQNTTKHFLTFDVSVSTRDLPQKKFVYFLFRFCIVINQPMNMFHEICMYVCMYVCMGEFVMHETNSLSSHECTPVGQTEKMCI